MGYLDILQKRIGVINLMSRIAAMACLVLAVLLFTPISGTALNEETGAPHALVINEIDYDQPGTDTAEFIEIKNVSADSVDLSKYQLKLINGNGGGAVLYGTILLPAIILAAGDYFVVCGDAATVINCDLDVTPNSDLIQNGAPDAVALEYTGDSSTFLEDTVSYEGNTGAPYTEDSGIGLTDNPAVAKAGISRYPDGSDTDQNNVDLSLRCISPGTANFAAASNCGISRITISKDAMPDDAQDFEFTGSGSIGSFSLDDDADETIPSQRTFTLEPGNYTIQETIPNGWDLTNVECHTTDTGEAVNVSENIVSVNLNDGEDVACTLTNVKRGRITVVKDAEPADGTDFTIAIGGDGSGDIILDDADPDDSDIAQDSESVFFVPGYYTLTEAVPDGWNLAGLECTTTDDAEPVDETNNIAAINLDAGEEVACTFSNVREQGSITIVKDAVPNDGQDFEFTASNPIGAFSLDDDADGTLPAQQTFVLAPGSYGVQENPASGWDITDLVCETDDSNEPISLAVNIANINLDDGEDVTCTFTNVKRGRITVVKEAEPADGTDFTVAIGGDGAGNIVVDDADSDDGDANHNSESILLAPGSYTLTEQLPSGWNLASLDCTTTDNNEPVIESGNLAAINMDPAEEVTCIFTNNKADPRIALDKQAPVVSIGGEPITYTYAVSNPGNAALSNITVSDDNCSPVTYQSGDDGDNLLEAGETWIFSCAYTPPFPTHPWSSKKLTNHAAATGFYAGQSLEANDSVTLYPLVVEKKIYLYWGWWSKVLSPSDDTPFTVEVYQGNTTIGTYSVSRSAPLKLWLGDGIYTFEEVNLAPGYFPVNSSLSFQTGQTASTLTLRNVSTFDLSIEKTGPAAARKGQTVTYNYAVTNAGPASVKPKVHDNKCSPVTYVGGDADRDGRIDPAETWTFQCRYKVTAKAGARITNTATVLDALAPWTWSLGGDMDMSNNRDAWTLEVVR